MFKKFLMKQAMKSQLKNVPESEQAILLDLVEKNPDFFENLAKEIKEGMDSGKDQQTVMMEVMEKHKAELGALIKR